VSLFPVRVNGRRTRDKLAGGLPPFTLASLRSSIRHVQVSPSTLGVYSYEMVVGELGIEFQTNPRRARGRGCAQGRTQDVSEHGLRHITRMGKRSRQGQMAWNVELSAAVACYIAPQWSILQLSACHVTPRKQPRIEAKPLYGEVPRPKIQTSPLRLYFLKPN
jgi:hypothetical protein